MDAEQREKDAVRGERERDRITDEEQYDERGEHRRRHERVRHQRGPAPGWCAIPRRTAMRLITSDTPCSASNAKPSGIRSFTGQRKSPPASLEISWPV